MGTDKNESRERGLLWPTEGAAPTRDRASNRRNEIVNPSHHRDRRLNFDTAMMLTALSISHSATCTRRAVGCVLTLDRHIIATGFNGAPKGLKHCLDGGCLLNDMGHCINCIHAEANAAMRCKQADKAYCTDMPCINCMKLMIQKGVKRFFYYREYRDADTRQFLQYHYGKESEWPLWKISDSELGLLKMADSNIKSFMYGEIIE